jgi:hypothetical protein
LHERLIDWDFNALDPLALAHVLNSFVYFQSVFHPSVDYAVFLLRAAEQACAHYQGQDWNAEWD